MFLIVGVVKSVMGQRARNMFGPEGKWSMQGLLILVAGVGLGILLYGWVLNILRSYGYEFKD